MPPPIEFADEHGDRLTVGPGIVGLDVTIIDGMDENEYYFVTLRRADAAKLRDWLTAYLEPGDDRAPAD